ncbi:unnamed protein product [Amoebophrya sp. A120]|nr:unnamed protein product [Amoebophrya sp. A120]|eukprot:GSA120T00021614001.1
MSYDRGFYLLGEKWWWRNPWTVGLQSFLGEQPWPATQLSLSDLLWYELYWLGVTFALFAVLLLLIHWALYGHGITARPLDEQSAEHSGRETFLSDNEQQILPAYPVVEQQSPRPSGGEVKKNRKTSDESEDGDVQTPTSSEDGEDGKNTTKTTSRNNARGGPARTSSCLRTLGQCVFLRPSVHERNWATGTLLVVTVGLLFANLCVYFMLSEQSALSRETFLDMMHKLEDLGRATWPRVSKDDSPATWFDLAEQKLTDMGDVDVAKVNVASRYVAAQLRSLPPQKVDVSAIPIFQPNDGETEPLTLVRDFAWVSSQTVRGVFVRQNDGTEGLVSHSSILQQMLKEWIQRRMDGARVLEMYLSSNWCDSDWAPRRQGPCGGGLPPPPPAQETAAPKTAPRAPEAQPKIPTIDEIRAKRTGVVGVELPDERGPRENLHYHQTTSKTISGASNQWLDESAWVTAAGKGQTDVVTADDPQLPARLRQQWLGYFVAVQNGNFMSNNPLQNAPATAIRVDLFSYRGMSPENLYELCLDAFEDAVRAALISIRAVPGSQPWSLTDSDFLDKVHDSNAWTFVWLKERGEYVKCVIKADKDDPFQVPALPPKNGEMASFLQRHSNANSGTTPPADDFEFHTTPDAPEAETATELNPDGAGAQSRRRRKNEAGFLSPDIPEMVDDDVANAGVTEEGAVDVNVAGSTPSASAAEQQMRNNRITSSTSSVLAAGFRSRATAAQAKVGRESLLQLPDDEEDPEFDGSLNSSEPPPGCVAWWLNVDPKPVALQLLAQSRFCQEDPDNVVIPVDHRVVVSRFELDLYMLRQKYRRFFLGATEDNSARVSRPTWDSLFSLRLVWKWLHLVTFAVLALRFLVRLLTAYHVDPEVYPKGACSYFLKHWTAWLELLLVLPGVFFTYLALHRTAEDFYGSHLIYGTKEIMPGYFLFLAFDVADCYLVLRRHSAKLLLRVYVIIARPYAYALLLMLGAWVTIGGGYWLTPVNREMLPGIGNDQENGSGLQPSKEAANLRETAFSSIGDAMYHVFVNFNGEFPLGTDHLTFWSRFWALMSVFVGVLILTIPVGIFSKALQETLEETQADQLRQSLEDEEQSARAAANRESKSTTRSSKVEPTDRASSSARGSIKSSSSRPRERESFLKYDLENDEAELLSDVDLESQAGVDPSNKPATGSKRGMFKRMETETILDQQERLDELDKQREHVGLSDPLEDDFIDGIEFRPGFWKLLGSLLIRRSCLYASASVGMCSILVYIVFDYYQGYALFVYDQDTSVAFQPCSYWDWNYLCGRIDRSQRYSTFSVTATSSATTPLDLTGAPGREEADESPNYLHGDYYVAFNTLLVLETVCMLFFLLEYLVRLVDNNWHERWISHKVQRRIGAKKIRYEIDTSRPYPFTVWGIVDLIAWLPSCVMLIIFAYQSTLDNKCDTDGHKYGCIDLTQDWIWNVYWFVCFRALKMERLLHGFSSIRKILGQALGLYEFFLVVIFSLMLTLSVVLHITEVNNPDNEMRRQVWSFPRSLWAVVLTVNGESPWSDYTYKGRVVHVYMMLLAVPFFAVPCGLFANAYHKYLGQIQNPPPPKPEGGDHAGNSEDGDSDSDDFLDHVGAGAPSKNNDSSPDGGNKHIDDPLDYEDFLADDETKKSGKQLSRAPQTGLSSVRRAFSSLSKRTQTQTSFSASSELDSDHRRGGENKRDRAAFMRGKTFESVKEEPISRTATSASSNVDAERHEKKELYSRRSAGHATPPASTLEPDGWVHAQDENGEEGSPLLLDEQLEPGGPVATTLRNRKSVTEQPVKGIIRADGTKSKMFVRKKTAQLAMSVASEDLYVPAPLSRSSQGSAFAAEVTVEDLCQDWKGCFPSDSATVVEQRHNDDEIKTGATSTTTGAPPSSSSPLAMGLRRRMLEEEQRRERIYPAASEEWAGVHRVIWSPDHVLLASPAERFWAKLRKTLTMLLLPLLFFNTVYYSTHHFCALHNFQQLEDWRAYLEDRLRRLGMRSAAGERIDKTEHGTTLMVLSYHNNLRMKITLTPQPDAQEWTVTQETEQALYYPDAAFAQPELDPDTGGVVPPPPRLFRAFPASYETQYRPPDHSFLQRYLVRYFVSKRQLLVACSADDSGDDNDSDDPETGPADTDHTHLTVPVWVSFLSADQVERKRAADFPQSPQDFLDWIEQEAEKLCKQISQEYNADDVTRSDATNADSLAAESFDAVRNDAAREWPDRQKFYGGRLVSREQALHEMDAYIAGYEAFLGIGGSSDTAAPGYQLPAPGVLERLRVGLFGQDYEHLPNWLYAVDLLIFGVFLIDYMLILLSSAKKTWYLSGVAGICHLSGLVGLAMTLVIRFVAEHDEFFNVYADLIYSAPGTAARYAMLTALSLRMCMVGYLDNLYPSIRMVYDSVVRYKREMMQASYIVLIVWLFASALFHLSERDNFGTQKDPGKMSTWRTIEGLDSEGHWRTLLRPVNYSRFYTILNSFQYIMIHLTGDYPITEYTNVGRILHFILMAAAAGFLAVPTGLFVAVYAQQLKLTRAATMHLARRFAAVRVQRHFRGVLARIRFRKLIQAARENKDLVQSAQPTCFEKFSDWCLSLVSTRPWQVTRFGYYFQWFMIVIHGTAALLGIVLSTRILQWVDPDDHGSFRQTAQGLWGLSLVCQCFFLVEYLLRLVAARSMPQLNFSPWRMFKKVASLLDLGLIVTWVACNLAVYAAVRNYDSNTTLAGPPFMKPTKNVVGPSRGEPSVPVEDWMEAVIWDRVPNFLLALHIWRLLHALFFADWSLHVSGHLATQQLMANAGILALFVFLIGGTLWWLCERQFQNEFDSLWSGIYGGSIFLLSEWFVCDFQVPGKILCIFYCVAGVGMFGIATGAIYDGLGEGLNHFVKYRQHVTWSMLKEDFHDREMEARQQAREILDDYYQIAPPGERVRVTHLLLPGGRRSVPSGRYNNSRSSE